MDVKQIQKIAEVMQGNGLTMLELTQGDVSLRMERQPAQNIIIPTQGIVPAQGISPIVAEVPASDLPAREPSAVTYEVKSPLAGKLFLSDPQSGDLFAAAGAQIQKEDTLCLIEAAGKLNEIRAECGGEITALCAKDGQQVERGQVLMKMTVR